MFYIKCKINIYVKEKHKYLHPEIRKKKTLNDKNIRPFI